MRDPLGGARPVESSSAVQKNNVRDPLGGARPVEPPCCKIQTNYLKLFPSYQFARGRCSKHGLIAGYDGGCHEHVKMIEILQVELLSMAAMLMSKWC